MLPNELKIYIYEYCCSPTKVLLNKVFKWNFYALNPLQNIFRPCFYFNLSPETHQPSGTINSSYIFEGSNLYYENRFEGSINQRFIQFIYM